MIAVDSLRTIVLSGVSMCCASACRRACSASASALRCALPSAQPSNVQTSCLEVARPAAVGVFAWAPVAHAAAPPGPRCRERQREADGEGKIKGRGTQVRAKPVCTWGGRGTPPGVASCRRWLQDLAAIGYFLCLVRWDALVFDGVPP